MTIRPARNTIAGSPTSLALSVTRRACSCTATLPCWKTAASCQIAPLKKRKNAAYTKALQSSKASKVLGENAGTNLTDLQTLRRDLASYTETLKAGARIVAKELAAFRKLPDRKLIAQFENEAAAIEKRLDQLETVVKKLESAELPLEDALTLFEQGIDLSAKCRAELEAAETRVEILLKKGQSVVPAPMDSE